MAGMSQGVGEPPCLHKSPGPTARTSCSPLQFQRLSGGEGAFSLPLAPAFSLPEKQTHQS